MILHSRATLQRTTRTRLTAKQQRFAAEYLVDLCGTKAAVRAGYSAKNADAIASRLLRHPGIRRTLAEHEAKADAERALTVERLEAELARIAYVDPRKLRGEDGRVLELQELDEDTARAVASVKHRIAKVVRGPKAPATAEALGIKPDEGRTVELVELGTVETRFHSKPEAIALGLKRRGALIERHQVEVQEEAPELTREEWELLSLLQHVVRPFLANPSDGEARQQILRLLEKQPTPASEEQPPLATSEENEEP